VKRILGIDPGTRFCGYGVVDFVPRSKPLYIECGVIQLDASLSLPQRLYQLSTDLRDVILEFQPQHLAVESIFYGKNVQSALRLGYARGVVMMLVAEYALEFYEYAPNAIKRAVSGHGHARKEDMQRVVMWQCGLASPPDSDAADALAIALCHSFSQQLPEAFKSSKKRRDS